MTLHDYCYDVARPYHSALQHLLDRVYIRLCEADDERRTRLQENLERIQPLLES